MTIQSYFRPTISAQMDETKGNKDFLKDLGKQISTIRKEKDISQVELGRRCGIQKQNMNRIEKGGQTRLF